ncbi:MAG: sce7726 family protein [Lachnospiraceae bacterium]
MKLYDEDIRDPLFDYLEEQFGKIRVFEEKNIGRSRADMLMLTDDNITGIEIKSDADTYERLKRQIRFYNRYCDRNYIAIGKSHEKHVEKHIPDFWGILILSIGETGIMVTEKRPPLPNPKMKREHQLTLLWRPELQRILEKNNLPHYKQKSKKFVQEKLLEKLNWETLKMQMCEELFERDYSLWEDELKAYRNR